MGEYINNFVLVYLNDIVVFSTTEYEHEHYRKLVFQKLKKHKLQAKHKKCEFGKPRVKYLGYVASSGQVYMDYDKVAIVANWEAPKDIKGGLVVFGFCQLLQQIYPCFFLR